MKVIVVGAGPVGLAAALALLRRGVDVLVLEAGESLAAESRASTLHPPTLEILDELGVIEDVLRRGLRAPTFAYRDRAEGHVATLDLGLLAGDTRYPFRVQLEQSKLTPILLGAILQAGGDVRFGRPVTAVETTGTVHTGTGTHHADWVVAADGAHSAVRRSLGLPFEGMTYAERFLVASTDEDLTEMLPDLAAVNYVFDPVDWSVLLRTPDHWRVLLPTPGDTEDDAELSRMDGRLRSIADPGRPWRIAHTTIYRVHQRVAADFRAGRVLLAGDAAHVNNPLGGLGMNSGIHDAMAYARAIADPGACGDDVFAAADRRRKTALDYVQTVSHQNYQRLSAADPGQRRAYLDEWRAVAADPVRARASLLRSSMLASMPAAS
ncbi:FAD-dependent oxidoreductase [Hamadaea tsunoensis]|uniref:FAD-dependent oxidoreductase n=1 Tax=Hamadaea tsunoensis TaxID=53368 RepID=UPI00041C54D1|nr:NAD(P)/FAD-dependent oxidoreductase [Hamadaea tsunoensis]